MPTGATPGATPARAARGYTSTGSDASGYTSTGSDDASASAYTSSNDASGYTSIDDAYA